MAGALLVGVAAAIQPKKTAVRLTNCSDLAESLLNRTNTVRLVQPRMCSVPSFTRRSGREVFAPPRSPMESSIGSDIHRGIDGAVPAIRDVASGYDSLRRGYAWYSIVDAR
jgi:hypothetical protein